MANVLLVFAWVVLPAQVALALKHVDIKKLDLRSIKSWDVPPPVDECSAESSVFTVDPRPRTNNMTLRRVMAPSFMSAGSTWLRKLLEEASGKPTCAVYNTEGCWVEALEAYCRNNWAGIDQCDLDAAKGDAFYVKTHWPAFGWTSDSYEWILHNKNEDNSENAVQPLIFNLNKLRDGDDIDMHFSTLLVVVRHPLLEIASIMKRWNYSPGGGAGMVYCWSAWWARVLNELPQEKVKVVKYEDLCEKTDKQVDKLLDFFGYDRKTTSHSSALDCAEQSDIASASAAIEAFKSGKAAEVMDYLQPILKLWGYDA